MLSHPVEMVFDASFTDKIGAIAASPPALTRLEPQSVSGDPRHGAEAVVADPLWMIGRQWQLGELLGEDTGSPVSVTVGRRSLPITAWAPAGRTDGADGVVAEPQWRPWPEGAVLDELVEHVPRAGAEHGLRWRAETGAQLADMLREAGHGDAAALLFDAHPLTLELDPGDPQGRLDPAGQRLFLALTRAVPDGGAARTALEAGTPAWVTGAGDPNGARTTADEWLVWVSGSPDAGGAWTTARLEHRFLLRFGHGDDAVVLSATAFGPGSARWHHFEWLKGEDVRLEGDANLTGVEVSTDVMLATPLRYPGMPADRYWQLEEGSVDVSAIEAQPHDLARLCLAEFALVSGDDWLIVPVDGKLGAVNQVLEVSVTTTFGETLVISEAGAERRGRGFRMFEVTTGGGESLDGIVLPPIAATPLLGEPVEEIAFLRDETTNTGWAVERVVAGPSGDPRQRSAEPQPQRPVPPPDLDPEDVSYELQVPVPRHWIPLVPVRTAPGVIGLRKGAMLDDGEPILPASTLLEPTPLTFPAEEIPREGITVRAVPALARRADGTYARWTGHLDLQRDGDLLVGHPVLDERHDLQLARGQRLLGARRRRRVDRGGEARDVTEEGRRHPRGADHLPACHRPDGADNVLHRLFACDIARHPGLGEGEQVALVLGDRDRDHLGRARGGQQFADGLQRAGPRHVEEHDVGAECGGLRRHPRRRGHQLDSGLGAQCGGEALAVHAHLGDHHHADIPRRH